MCVCAVVVDPHGNHVEEWFGLQPDCVEARHLVPEMCVCVCVAQRQFECAVQPHMQVDGNRVMLDILCSETAYLSHMYEFWNITSMSWGGERESNKVLSTDLAEWHQEAEQRWYLDTQQCHRGSHLLCVFVCIRVRVCSPICCVHPGDISSSSSNSLTYTHRDREASRGRMGT